MDWILALAAAAAVAVPLVRAYWWPYGPCPACQGRRGRGRGSNPGSWSRCRKCGGSGERIRPLALLYRRHREERRRR